MAGFPTVDSVVNAWSVNRKGQKLFFNKVMPSVSVANTPHTLWTATGLPGAGAYGSVGKANGRVCYGAQSGSFTAGAFRYQNATSPATQHLISLGGTSITSSGTGTLILVDRVSDCLLAHAETTGSITGVTATSRLESITTPGDGCQIWCEVQTGFSAASNTITFTYTNQLGTGSRTTQNMVTVASAIAGRSVNANLWQGLQAGDTGVRSIESLTLVSGTATGQYAVCLVRPLASIPMPAVAQYVERDFVVELPNLEKIFDDSCLQLIYVPTAAVTATLFGEIRIASN
jgi:hypothetical protein